MNNRIHTIDNPFLAPPGTYPPATIYWDYTSSTSPAGAAEFIIPWQAGTPLGLLVPIQWQLTDVFFRTETPGSTNTTLFFDRYTGTGPFVTTNLLNAVPIIIPAGANEATGRPFTLATINMPFVNSGDKIQPSIVLGTGVTVITFVATFTQTPGV